MSKIILSIVIFFSGVSVFAAKPNPDAPQGGTLVRELGAEPSNLHPIMNTDAFTRRIEEYVVASLLTMDPETWEYKPGLAERWEISKDKKVYTFFLRKNLKFPDGSPLTADDVKFSFEMVNEPKYNAAAMKTYYEGIEKVEVVDPNTVKITAKDTYFLNFNVASTSGIYQKSKYSDVDKSIKMTKEINSAGPYVIEKYDRGSKIILKKNPNWYGWGLPEEKGANNFEKIVFKFVKDENVVLEMMKKSELDFYFDVRAEVFVKKAMGEPFGSKVVKVEAENSRPQKYSFVGWNMKKPIFKDKKVRRALNHLFNREEIIKKFLYDKSIMATGPVYLKSPYASPRVKAIEFNPKKAQQLLAEAGWKDTDKNGVLDKMIDGKKVEFSFTLNYANKDVEKYFTLFKEDLKKAGIQMNIQLLEWNTFVKMLDDMNFDALAMAWAASSPEWDPKQIWHSENAVVGGSNFVSYKNPEVDKLIDKARYEMDRSKRVTMLQKVYELIADDAPYIFMFNSKYDFYLVQDSIKRPADTFKYTLGQDYWWMSK